MIKKLCADHMKEVGGHHPLCECNEVPDCVHCAKPCGQFSRKCPTSVGCTPITDEKDRTIGWNFPGLSQSHFDCGRSEGWSDIAAALRQIVDPTDAKHLNVEGLLKLVGDIKTERDRATELLDQRWQQIRFLRDELERERAVRADDTCAYCLAPLGRPTGLEDGAARARDHAKVCEKHPMQKIVALLAEYRQQHNDLASDGRPGAICQCVLCQK